jgi:3-deoxy-7-phosphoheptulonate synthase
MFHPEDTEVKVGNQSIGGKKLSIIAGPCSVESEDQILSIAQSVKESGAGFLRGGAFKPRTSPYSFQGLELDGLELLKKAKAKTGLPIVSEIMSTALIEEFVENVDVIQVGARNMQNFDLLKELGKTNKPILLKRGMSATIEELLMSAEYIMSGGNENVILCERGIRTFEKYTRNTLDLSAIPAIKKLSHLPVIVDPSHSTGLWWMVEPLTKAAVVAGADGLIIEVHNDPKNALCDGNQSVKPDRFNNLMDKLKVLAQIEGREI